jgi:fluoroacetyl-CoA thioesterase
MEQIVPGLTGVANTTVNPENTAQHLGSGSVQVFATPQMILLMEMAAVKAIDHLLPEGFRTVGIGVNLQHLAATPVGMTITAKAELVEVDGRRLHLRVEAWDEQEKIGEGTHSRAIIEVQRFRQKVQEKAARAENS